MLSLIKRARSPVDRTLASGAESVGSIPAERTILFFKAVHFVMSSFLIFNLFW